MKKIKYLVIVFICQIFVLSNSLWALDIEHLMAKNFELFLKKTMEEHNVPGFTIGVVKG
ncbi:MAG: hypothetical protein GY774_26365 [Planctomycetes bacterium]|nr:hypothetical protein [Planctomycetota bacterium]